MSNGTWLQYQPSMLWSLNKVSAESTPEKKLDEFSALVRFLYWLIYCRYVIHVFPSMIPVCRFEAWPNTFNHKHQPIQVSRILHQGKALIFKEGTKQVRSRSESHYNCHLSLHDVFHWSLGSFDYAKPNVRMCIPCVAYTSIDACINGIMLIMA